MALVSSVPASNTARVRMIGLNAPETGKQGQSAEPFADAARKRLQTLVAQSSATFGAIAT